MTPETAARLVGILRCHHCHRSVDRTAAELLTHTRDGWPKCCGEVMTLYTATSKPTADPSPTDDTTSA
jgi:hypothetical protein